MEKKAYAYADLVKNLEDLDPETLDSQIFGDMLFEFSRLFAFLGKVMSTAFSDVTSKADIIQKNAKYEMHANCGGKIQSIIDHEIEKNIHELNGDNNKKLGHPKNTEFNHYVSTARTIFRMMWFLQFNELLLGSLATDQDLSLKKACTAAYDKALGPHHSWGIRTGAKAGMMTVPKRDKFIEQVTDGAALSNGERLERLARLRDLLARATKDLWRIYNEKNLLSIP